MKSRSTEDLAQLEQLLLHGGLAKFRAALARLTVPELRSLSNLLIKRRSTQAALSIAKQLQECPDIEARILAAMLLGKVGATSWARAKSGLERLADDLEWPVREAAACGMKEALRENFPSVYPSISRWAVSKNARHRRAAALAVMIGRSRDPGTVAKLLHVVELLLDDNDAYVRKSVGPFALGYLGYTYPAAVLPRIKEWAFQKHNPRARWNLAMAFSQALGRRFPGDALAVLSALLSQDDHPVVRAAAVASLRNVAKVAPAAVSKAIQAAVWDGWLPPAVLARLGPNSPVRAALN
ncbi:MAG: HEAT repeat domain-containing protein [Planctomycetota bacterium]